MSGRLDAVTRRLYIDTSSVMYRAYYALPTSITDGRKRPINAVHGYLDMTAALIRTRRPQQVVHVYDAVDTRYPGHTSSVTDAPPTIGRRSSTRTERPARARYAAVTSPLCPPPITMASYRFTPASLPRPVRSTP